MRGSGSAYGSGRTGRSPRLDAPILIVVFDPDRRMVLSQKTPHMKVDYSPYEGREVTGPPRWRSRAAA